LLIKLGILCNMGGFVKTFNWDNEKNEWLKNCRNITFEEVTLYISSQHLLDIVENENYKDQKIFVIEIENYVYLVPFVENEKEIFLKTVYPSRKATKVYLGNKDG